VWLHRERGAAGVEHARMRREIRGQDRPGARWWRDDLILVRAGERDARALDQAIVRGDVVDVPPDAQPFSDLRTVPPTPARSIDGRSRRRRSASFCRGPCARNPSSGAIQSNRVVDAGRGAGDEDRLQPSDIGRGSPAGMLTVLKVTLGRQRRSYARTSADMIRGARDFSAHSPVSMIVMRGISRYLASVVSLLRSRRDTSVSLLVMNSSSTGMPSCVF